MALDLEKLKVFVEIINSLVVSLGIIIGGIWGYYKYVKGRLFSTQVEIIISGFILKNTGAAKLASAEINIKNTGSTKLKPNNLQLVVMGISSDKTEIKHEQIHATGNLLTDPIIEPNTWYLEPQQSDWFSAVFLVPAHYDLLRLVCILNYNKAELTTTRHIIIDPEEKFSSLQTNSSSDHFEPNSKKRKAS